jgi:hypothetical protein
MTTTVKIHHSDKMGSNYFPKKPKQQNYAGGDDRNHYHKFNGWRDCEDPYCFSHLDLKIKKSAYYIKPDDYDQVWEKRRMDGLG